jgi:hypothetical protein
VLYGFQWVALYLCQVFTVGTVFSVLFIGFFLVTASWLVRIFGEERTVSFVQNHPYLFAITVVLFTSCTGGLAYWAYSRDADDLHANLRSRLAKHSQIFKVA